MKECISCSVNPQEFLSHKAMEHAAFSASRKSDAEGASQEALLDVLVVDDQPSVQKMVKKMIYDLNYFKTIDLAEDGEAAWKRLKNRRTEQFDVVLTDIYMPRLDGIGLIRRCRKSTFARDVPFLVITGETKPEVLAVLSEIGVRDCLVKPFSLQLLKDRINMVLQRLADPVEKSHTEITHLVADGDYHEALARLEQLGGDESVKPRWLNLRGEIHLGMGDLIKARECIEKALTFCDAYLTALCNHAKLEEKAGNTAAAVESLEKADAISPLMVDRKITLADLLFQLDRDEDGKKILCKAASITNDVETKLQISEMLNDNGFNDDSNKIIDRLLYFKYANVETFNKIGISLRKQSKFSKAEKAYIAALNYHPDNATIYYNLGILYLYASNKSKACLCFNNALAHKKDFAEAQEMLDIYSNAKSSSSIPTTKSYPKEVDDV